MVTFHALILGATSRLLEYFVIFKDETLKYSQSRFVAETVTTNATAIIINFANASAIDFNDAIDSIMDKKPMDYH